MASIEDGNRCCLSRTCTRQGKRQRAGNVLRSRAKTRLYPDGGQDWLFNLRAKGDIHSTCDIMAACIWESWMRVHIKATDSDEFAELDGDGSRLIFPPIESPSGSSSDSCDQVPRRACGSTLRASLHVFGLFCDSLDGNRGIPRRISIKLTLNG